MEQTRVDPETAVENFEIKSNNGKDLMSAFATPDIPPDMSDVPQHETSINDTQDAMEGHSESSTSSSRRQSEEEGYYLHVEEDGDAGAKSASSRSSLSSIPDSVIHHEKERSIYSRDSIGEIYEEHEEHSAYGNPMQTEDEEDEDVMSPSRRKAMFRGSPASVRSLGSPLLRRHGYHSAGNTPRRSLPIKRENPLVLLHCNILQPTVVLGPGVSLPDRQILEKVLPPQYARRWELLEENISGSGLLRDRGLLIQHPQEDYGLLEERLLESLELEKPRLENGHYNNHKASESENETGEEEPDHPNQQDKGGCVDCGCHMNHRDDRRKWDVKFYAANGLMKEGAWTAAWKEIERVDVQVSLWLPYEVKSEVEKKIKAEILVAEELKRIKEAEAMVNEPQPSSQIKISQDEIDGLDDGLRSTTKNVATQVTHTTEHGIPTFERARTRKRNADPDLYTLIINSIRVLASDRRNIITAISMLIAVLTIIFGGRSAKRTQYGYDMAQFGDFPAVSTQVYQTSSAPVLTQPSAEIPIYESKSRVERAGEVQRMVEGVLGVMKPDLVQPVVSRREAKTVIELVEQKTIEIPVEPKAEAIATIIRDAVDSAPTNKPDESNPGSFEAEVNHTVVQKNESDTQKDDDVTTEEGNATDTQIDDAVVEQNGERAIPQDTSHVVYQENDSVPAKDDGVAISQTENPITRDPEPVISTENASAATQDDDFMTIQDDEPAIAEDGPSTPELDINETA
uniref:Uncharacterized protein n=1 Tax=Talaromyces marneffei PM1 TaxID=1077442 RepID=A0A093W1C0_TALMA